ncbi:MAG: DUF429 domain-containing protein [Proteobacteria bacterium]|nr:DUF429 domain-containing protein [Pseudomonadota bacterium]MCP4915769.1 DUF429 domain-containing protein [Pseudomonadota bacterium]
MLEPSEDGGIHLVSTAHLRAHEDVLGWVARNRGRGGCILAVNAPIIVENSGGRRPVDEQLAHHFGRFYVDEYAANTVNTSHPRTIGRALQRMGFDPDPQAEADRVIETASQAAQILMFELDRPLRIKSGPIGARKDAANRYRELIYGKLPFCNPELEDGDALEELMNVDLGSLNGSRLGELEGKLDAVLSGYIAGFLDLRGPKACAFLGDLRSGYILLPTQEEEEGETTEAEATEA